MNSAFKPDLIHQTIN